MRPNDRLKDTRFNYDAHDEDDNVDAEKDGTQQHHPLATQEWLASRILQDVGETTGNVSALCELALVNKNFLAAFKCDPLWHKLLPPASHLDSLFKDQSACDADAHELLECYRNAHYSKKALFQRLCRPISLAKGSQKFWLDRRTSRECFIMSARALSITWGSSPEYWEWQHCEDAWFPEVAYLRSVCWFEVKGKFRQMLRPGSYIISFRLQIHSASTWRWSPIKLSLHNVTYAHESVKSCSFFRGEFPISGPAPVSVLPHLTGPRSTKWIECDVGEFTVEASEDSPVEVDFSMCETEVLNWKSGVLLDGVFIRPTCVVDALQRQSTIASDDDGDQYDYGESDDDVVDDVFGDDDEQCDADVPDVEDDGIGDGGGGEFMEGAKDEAHKLSDVEE